MHKHYLHKGLLDSKSVRDVVGPAISKVKNLFIKEAPAPKKEAPAPKKEAPAATPKSNDSESWTRLVKKKELSMFGVPFNAAGNMKISYKLANRMKSASEDFKRAHPKDYEIIKNKIQGSYKHADKVKEIGKTQGKGALRKYMKANRSEIGSDGIWPAGGFWASGAGGRHTNPYMVDFAYPWKWAAEPEKYGLSKEGVKYFSTALNNHGVRFSRKDAKHLVNHLEISKKELRKVQDLIVRDRPKLNIKIATPTTTEEREDAPQEATSSESSLPRAARGSAKDASTPKGERLIISEAPKSKESKTAKPLPKRTVKPYKAPKVQAKQRSAGVVQEKKPLRGPGKQRTRVARPRRYQAESFREA
jgi:hypothetical protein